MLSLSFVWSDSSLLLLFAAVSASLCALADGASKRILRLDRLINPFVKSWRYAVGEAPGAERADFDDSKWAKCEPGVKWEGEHIAWFRGRITIPETVVGIPTKGSLVQFRAGVDQDGQAFVNGQLRQHFWRDHCSVVLAEESEPGQSFLVALRGSRHQEQGEFLWSLLHIGAVEAAIPDVQDYILDFRFGEQLLTVAKADVRGKLERALTASTEHLDIDALESGDIDAFRKSLAPAQAALKPVADFSKKFACHLVGHAHIDMNWLWLWPETVEVCQNTFTAMTDLMEEYPGFSFSQSQPTTYIAVQDTMPDLFAKMKMRIKDGRWEITGGTWVEGDMNMASGESIVRQILYAKRYFRETFGKEPEVCWEPDTFGHAWTLPQILKKSGLKYYYHMRCGKGEPLYWWEGPEGSRVLVYNDPSYADNIRHQAGLEAIEMNKRCGVNDAMIVYGVGDHGGGPTRHDLESITKLRKRMVYPDFKYSTFYEYMRAVEAQSPKIPVIRDELNFVFDGCYTTHADIKRMNRTSENTLPAVEAFSVIARTRKRRYPSTAFREAWQITCFNQFHDIFDGSGIHGTYDYSREVYEKAASAWTSAMTGALSAIAGDINTEAVEGVPVVVFNPLSWERTEIVEVEASRVGKRGRLSAVDEDGNATPIQKVGNKLIFLAAGVPSLGYKVFWIDKKKAGEAATVKADGTTLENEYLRVKVHPKKGLITSIYDKVYCREIVPKGSFADQLQILMEKPHGMTAWTIGPISSSKDLKTAESVELVSEGPNYAAVKTTHKFRKSRFTQQIGLKAGARQVEVRLTADWYEQGAPKKDAAMLKVAFPVDVDAKKTTYEIPFGFIQRDNTGDEYPGLKWIDQSEDGYGVSLMNDNKYGHDTSDGRMRLTLLRSSYDPDPEPDQGVHDMTYVLYPHAGDWRQGHTVRRAWELNNPLIATVAESHKGALATSRSFVSIEPGNLVVTALKMAEDSDDIVLRFFEAFGEPAEARIQIDLPVQNWVESDLMERELPKTGGKITKGAITLPVGKHEIKTLLLR
ncbi:MAG: glycoside hydrolase family 38 C-terminal domain-containing protein [Armatimonadota bacterium]|nr:glycoside hydrolase family 38 C-terminal domain-containing protein [Armatimonadota bacterium]